MHLVSRVAVIWQPRLWKRIRGGSTWKAPSTLHFNYAPQSAVIQAQKYPTVSASKLCLRHPCWGRCSVCLKVGNDEQSCVDCEAWCCCTVSGKWCAAVRRRTTSSVCADAVKWQKNNSLLNDFIMEKSEANKELIRNTSASASHLVVIVNICN